MKIKLDWRKPGGHTHIGWTHMDSVPRQGETLFYLGVGRDETAWVVHEVTWHLLDAKGESNYATLLLRDVP